MSVFCASLLVIILLAGWLMTVLGMPGNWLMVVAVVIYVLLVPERWPVAIGWPVAIALGLLAAVGELLEFLAGAFGVAKAGGSKRGALLAMLGSIVGGIAGLFIGVPIPIVGPIIAALLFAGLGALAGTMIGERWYGRNLGRSWQIGKAAFWGRLLGTLAKTAVGAVMVVVAVAALLM
jgi:uncharacterized protein